MILKLLRASVRLLLLMAIVATVAAIGLGRANRTSPPKRIASPPSYQVLDQAITALHGGDVFLVDLETGRLQTLSLPPGVAVDKASLSPWEKGGRRQIVGAGWNRSGDGQLLRRTDIGLIRMSLPDGEILDRLTSADVVLPACSPCWIPGAPAGLLYVGNDFHLYRVDFEPSHSSSGLDDPVDTRPSPVDWQAPLPGAGGVQFRDLSWPDEPRMGGRAFASLRFKDRETGRFTDWQVWWLQLDRSGTSIVALGPLLEPGSSDSPVSMRLPSLVNVGGEPVLAYLVQRPGEPGWQLRVARIHFDRNSGSPQAHHLDSQPLAEDCLPTSPVPSPDGRWITVVRTGGPQLRTERIAIPGGAKTDLTSAIEDHLFAPKGTRAL